MVHKIKTRKVRKATFGFSIFRAILGGSLFRYISKYRPFFLALAASFFFGLSTFVSKLLSSGFMGDAIHPLQITHARFAFGLITVLLLIAFSGQKNFSRPNFRLHIIRCFSGWFGVAIMFSSITYIPTSDAVALIFMNPIFAMIFAVIFLSEKVGMCRWAAVGVAFTGALVLLRPEGWHFDPIALLCLLGAAAFGIEIIMIKLLSNRENLYQILFINNFIRSIIATIPLLKIAILPTGFQWIALASVGFIMVAGQILFLVAMQITDASVVAPYIYSTVLFVVVFDKMVLDVSPDFWSVLGGALIIGSGFFVAYYENIGKKNQY